MHSTQRALRLIPLAGLALAAVVACDDRHEPTGIAVGGPHFAQSAAAPVVNTLADPGDGTCADVGVGDGCTLREAINFASSGATITFAPGLSGTIAVTTQLSFGEDVTIAGPAAGTIAVSGSGVTRVFDVYTGQTIAMENLTITGGYASYGGGINNTGTVSLKRCVVTGNISTSDGGGIENSGVMTLDSSTVSGNQTLYNGGGIINDEGRLTILRSAIVNNVAGMDGGGIFSDAQYDTATLLNTTVSGNKAGDDGGGVRNYYGLTRVLLSTIAGNEAADVGAGLLSYNDVDTPTEVKGSIVWGNSTSATGTAVSQSAGEARQRPKPKLAPSIGIASVGGDVAADVADIEFISLGSNLVGTAGQYVDFTTAFTATGDQTDVADAKLGPLANNGGVTRTLALQSGSPAIDAGTCTDNFGVTVTTDQRGVSRPQGSTCDIGAYELVGSGGTTPNFTFDLSTLPAKTYGDGSFSVASYASSTNSSGAITFENGFGSVGCSVNDAGVVTLTGAATDADYCVIAATLGEDGTYASAGPILQSFHIAKASLTVTADDQTIAFGATPTFTVAFSGFVSPDTTSDLGGTLTLSFAGTGSTTYGPSTTPPTAVGTYSITPGGYTSNDYDFTWTPGTLTINKAAGSVSISNLPTAAYVGGSFMPTYTKLGDGTPSVTSLTPSVCSVSGGTVSYDAAGTCTLQASITEGTNYLAATGSDQSFTIASFTSNCTYTVNAKSDQRTVTVSWANTNPGVTYVYVHSGDRTATKLLAPTSTGSWTTKMRSGTPTYDLIGGTARRSNTGALVTGGLCTLQ